MNGVDHNNRAPVHALESNVVSVLEIAVHG